MSKFTYRVQDTHGKMMEGVLEAPSEEQAHQFLKDQHYGVVALKKQGGSWDFQKLVRSIETVNITHFNFFVRQLATLLKAGVPMLNSLVSLQEEIQDNILKHAVLAIARDVEGGTSFSDAISKHPKIFDSLFVSTVRAGEAVGELDSVLLRLAEILEKDYQTRSKIKAAMRYPLFIVGVMAVAFFITTLFIIPRFKSLFAQFGGDLPLPTKILMGCSNFVLNYWYLVFLMIGLAAAGLIYHYRSYRGKRFWDGLSLKLGIVGIFLKHAIFSRFTRMLGIMLKSGVNILQGLELVSDIVGNSVIADSIMRIRERVSQGEALSKEMRREGFYSGLLVQIVAAGEASGKMEDLLLQIAEYYDGEIDLMAKNVESLIEPIFILMLGGFVSVLALGIFLPMWNLYSLIQAQI